MSACPHSCPSLTGIRPKCFVTFKLCLCRQEKEVQPRRLLPWRCISRRLSLCFSNYEQTQRGKKLLRLLLSFLCCFQDSDPCQAPQLRKFLNLEVMHRYMFPRMSPPIHFISFFFFPKPRKKLVTGFISTFPVFLLGFLSLPPGALSLTDWKLISTQLTFHEHWGPFYLYWHNLSCSVGDISPSPVAQLP